MKRLNRAAVAALLATSFGLPAAPVFAQDEDPAAGAEDSPLVRQPETPSERLSAALLLLKLTRPDLAREQIAFLLSEEVRAEELLQLRNEFGTSTFLELARSPDLDPEADQLLERIVSLATESRADAAYLDDLLKAYDRSLSSRRDVIREFRTLGPAVVPDLLERAAADTADDLKIERILTAMGSDAVPPLAAALLTERNVPARSLAVRVLARVAGPADVAELAALAADPAATEGDRAAAMTGLTRLNASGAAFDAARTLRLAALDRLTGQAPIRTDTEGRPVFFAPTEAGPVARVPLPEMDAREAEALRLLSEAVRIDADDAKSRRLLSVLRLNRDPDGPAFLTLLERGPSEAETVLQQALDSGAERAAVAALNAASLAGRSPLVVGGSPSPVVRALDYPSQDVAFAAAEAVVRMRPEMGFSNSSRVVDILTRAVNADAAPKAVVIDPNARRGGDFGGRLVAAGFEPIAAATGREGFAAAAARGDVEMVALSAASRQWEFNRTLANLKADARTAGLPVVAYSETALRDRFDGPAATYQGVAYAPTLADAETLAAVVQESMPEGPGDANRRLRAVRLLREIAETGLSDVFPLTSAVTPLLAAANAGDPEVATAAAGVLAHVAAPDVQPSLLQIVASDNRPAVRRSAAAALASQLRRFGVALTSDDVRVLRDIRATADPELATLLAAARGLAGA